MMTQAQLEASVKSRNFNRDRDRCPCRDVNARYFPRMLMAKLRVPLNDTISAGKWRSP